MTNPIDQATKLGAKFVQKGPLWFAELTKRGRPQPLVRTQADTKEEAALLLVNYMQRGGTKE